ncbi:MAG: TRAP transporter substrate-binding protein DctP [Rhodospirillaceae bacterium]|jgi:TRAP-type transport system periplasmic protein|nr:TRAP transporter substrate-binding protein DctP [Rhodospirillaceae bacterium]MBT4590134.1 TRAP transporter substrate-binding protein DctP [Rhodospirillaceae bacterium]MBT4939466.1 TRAP transporter substrate-binding protein DctP [Rhodospirillaceae bacterium]MBT5939044.1 TRAP transporter substrate-binding protein DctP [Rhodospirillaceae bacterium]MBT7269134.1 TRAP transporter substrate-binding protein DctP [Rhodospirillaceae bacterium]
MSKYSKIVISTALAGSFVAASLMSSQPVQSAELLINNYLPPKHPFQVGVTLPWIKDVTKATNGSVTPKLSATKVGPPPKNWQTVTKGLADVVLMANIFQPKRIHLPTISQLPLGSPGALKTSIALWNTHEKFFKKANEYKGTKLVGSFVLSPNVIHSGKKPINSIADLKGFKLRAAPGITTRILKEFGAVPVASGPSKIFGLVSKGVVDGVAVPAHGLGAFRIMPYIKYTTVIPGGLTNTSFSLLINGKKWDGLTKQQRQQINTVSGMHVSKYLGIGDKIAAKNLAALQKAGGKVIQAGPALMEPIKKFAAKAKAEWLQKASAKGVDAKAAMAYFNSQLK